MLAFENLETESFESDSWTESPDAMGAADNFLNGLFIDNPIVEVPMCSDIAQPLTLAFIDHKMSQMTKMCSQLEVLETTYRDDSAKLNATICDLERAMIKLDSMPTSCEKSPSKQISLDLSELFISS